MAKKKKADEENIQNINDADDTFGLPEIEYEPIHRDEPKAEEASESVSEEPVNEPEAVKSEEIPASDPEPEPFRYEDKPEEPEKEPYSYSFREEQKSPSVLPIVLLVIFLFAIVGGGGWYYFYKYKPAQEAERIAQQALADKQANAKKEEERIAAQLREQQLAEERRVADSLANAMAPKEGMIETLSERTGRYYVVVASAIDDDLLMDNANKLSKKGAHVRIIPPFRKVQFFRLAVEDGDTYADAQAKADNLKGEYGDGVWVIKY